MLKKATLATRQKLFQVLQAANTTLSEVAGRPVKATDLTETEAQQIISDLQ